ncbi:hypothetical protein D3C72_1617540 [compost metagenome]
MFVGADDDADRLARRHRRIHAEQVDQAIDARRCARPRKNHHVRVAGATAAGDCRAGLTAQARNETATVRRFGVRIGVVRKHLFQDEALDLHQGAARCDVVGVDQGLAAKGAVDKGVFADQAVGKRGGDIAGFQAVLKLLQRSCRVGGRGVKRSHDGLPIDPKYHTMEANNEHHRNFA